MVFQASVASLFSPEAAEDPALFSAFQAFDQHMPLALAGFKVRPIVPAAYRYHSL